MSDAGGPNGPLTIDQRDEGGAAVIALTGELDAHSSRGLAECIDALAQAERREVVIDLADVGFVDSSGLRVLIRAQREFGDAGGSFLLRGASPAFTRLVEITGLTDLFAFEA
jgi:anti-anti-sigma factor